VHRACPPWAWSVCRATRPSLRVTGASRGCSTAPSWPALSQAELHAFVDELQLGIADLHGAIAEHLVPAAEQLLKEAAKLADAAQLEAPAA
jgi:hypothetical protein